MRAVNASYDFAIALSKLKIRLLIAITLRNGTVVRLTPGLSNITWDAANNVYTAFPMEGSPVEQKSNFEADKMSFRLANVTGGLADAVEDNLLDGATLRVVRINAGDAYAADKEIVIFNGNLEIESEGDELVIECVPAEDSMNIKFPKHTWQEPCNYCLFDDDCELKQEDYKYQGVATGGTVNTLVDATRGTAYKVAFDGGDETNPLEVGDVLSVAVNDFSADANCKALFNLEGTMLADSKGTNTLANSAVTAETTDFKQDVQSAHFNGSSSHFYQSDAALDAGFPLKNGDTNKKISISYWVKFHVLPSASAFASIVTKYSSNAISFFSGAYNDTTHTHFAFGIGKASDGGATIEYKYDANVIITTGVWYHVGMSYNDAAKAWSMRLYRESDGAVYTSSGTTTANINADTGYFEIGKADSLGGYLNGLVDEVVIFSDVVSVAEFDLIRQGFYCEGTIASSVQVANIIYDTAVTGTIWYASRIGNPPADNQRLVSGANQVIVKGTPVAESENTGLYVRGELAITSGDNDGQRRMILSDDAGTLTVFTPLPYPIAAGVTYDLYPGCDYTWLTCKNRFNNIENFFGFPGIPMTEEVFLP